MHTTTTLSLLFTACLTITACSSTQKTESIPATPLETPPAVAETPTTQTTEVEMLSIG